MSESQIDLSSLELDGIEDIQERQALPAGQYLTRVSNAEFRNSKAGNPMLQVICDFPDEPSGASVFHFVMLPTKELPDEQKHMRKLELKRILHAFSCEYGPKGFDPSELIGQECEMYVSVEQDDQGIDRNRLNPPRIK
jgi:hypothetical protein